MQTTDVQVRGVGLLQCVLRSVAVCLGMQVPDVQVRGVGVLQCVAVCCSVLQCVAVHLRMQIPDVQVRGIRILLIKTMYVRIEDTNFVTINVPRI